jgi:hypothetical protein
MLLCEIFSHGSFHSIKNNLVLFKHDNPRKLNDYCFNFHGIGFYLSDKNTNYLQKSG